jgi:plastocyanin
MNWTGKLLATLGIVAAVGLAGCSSEEATAAGSGEESGASTTEAGTAAATGNVIEVKMVTDDAGNYFEPSEVSAKPGDIVRFVLVSGVHNVSFPSASNAGAATLPEVSPYLQLPGQTHDLTVNLAPGSYTFQCDPHVALGMAGTLKVE